MSGDLVPMYVKHTEAMIDEIELMSQVLARGIECDIALLFVENEDFWKGAEPLRFGRLPCLHVFNIILKSANYKDVCCLSLTTLNIKRCSILLQHFMESGQVLTPQQVSKLKHILPVWASSWYSQASKKIHKKIHLGLRVSSLSHLEMMDLFAVASSHYQKANYLLMERKGVVSVVMHKNSTAADVLRAFSHAFVMGNRGGGESGAGHSESCLWMDKHFQVFIAKLQSLGWKTERLLASSIVWKADWIHDTLESKNK